MTTRTVEPMHAVASIGGLVALYAENDDEEFVIEVPRERIRAVMLACADALERKDSNR